MLEREVHGVAKSWRRLSDFTLTFYFNALEKEMASHASIAWRIPGTAEPGVLPSMGSHRVGHDWVTELNWTIAIWIHSLKKYPFRSLAHFWCVCVCVWVCECVLSCMRRLLVLQMNYLLIYFLANFFSTLRVVIFFRYGFPCCVSASKVNEIPCWVFLISIFHYTKRWIQREFAVIYVKACFSYAFL